MRLTALVFFIAASALGQVPCPTQEDPPPIVTPKIPIAAKVYLGGMDFESDFRKALLDGKVPVRLVDSKEEADFVATAQVTLHYNKNTSYAWHAPTPSAEGKMLLTNAAGQIGFYCSTSKRNAGKGALDIATICAKQLRELIAKR